MQIEGSFHRFVEQCSLFQSAICAELNFPVSMLAETFGTLAQTGMVMFRIQGALIAFILLANSAYAGLIFSSPQINGLPGESGTLFLGINSDVGPETLRYDLTGFSFTGVSPNIVVTAITTPIGSPGTILVPGLSDAPVLLAIGSYDILGTAMAGDKTSFDIGMKFASAAIGGGSSYDSELDLPVGGFVAVPSSVVPEPASLTIFCCLGLCPLYYRRR